MKKIDKEILKLGTELAKYTAEINELVDGISKFNLFDNEANSPASSVTKKYCKSFL